MFKTRLSTRNLIIASLGVTALMLLLGLYCSLRVEAAGGISLRPPFEGTYRQTAYFDHNHPDYGNDNEITIYTGESVADCSPHCYEGHSGHDWSMSSGTPVLAAADGVVVARTTSSTGYGWRLVIEHDNGHYTLYAHLSNFNVALNQQVSAGDIIGWSGDTGVGPAHLHFGTYRGPCVTGGGLVYEDNATDPFGWRGSYPDPLLNHPTAGNGHTAACLWRSSDQDPISCADTIVEDAALGSIIGGTWTDSIMGNGYHMYYRNTTTQGGIYASWVSTSTLAGPHQIYAYVPSQHATTLNATYWIWNGSDWEQAPPVRQLDYSDEWVPLGTYMLPANFAYVYMYADTGEGTSREIAADGVKFRQYQTYLPITLKDHPPCSPSYGQMLTNGNFSTGDDTGWTTSRTNCSAPIVEPYGSDYGAVLGRCHSNQDVMYQFACPATPADYAALSFRWWVTSYDSPYGDYDYLYVRVRDADGNLLQTLKTLTNRSPQGQWYYEYFDLLAYQGQMIRISFEASTDPSGETYFWVDDVSFYVADW